MGGESLWKILWKPVENSRIVLLFPPSNAYETVDELETSCEKPVPSHYTFVTRRWKDLSLFHYWVQHFPTWSPLAISVIIFTHIDNLLQVSGNFIIWASFDSYNTIKAIEISCIKAFDYSEHIKGMLYCWKKGKFVPKWERYWIMKLLDMYIAPKKRNMNMSQNTKER